MKATIDHSKRSIPMDDNLKLLGKNFIEYLQETSEKPNNMRYVGTITAQDNFQVNMNWGWSEQTKEPVVHRSELEEIKFDTIWKRYNNHRFISISSFRMYLEDITEKK